MWYALWYSLGRSAGLAARSVGRERGPRSGPRRSRAYRPGRSAGRSFGRRPVGGNGYSRRRSSAGATRIYRRLWRAVRADVAAALVMHGLGLAATRLRWAGSVRPYGALAGAFRRRAVLVCSGAYLSLTVLARVVSRRAGSSSSFAAAREQAAEVARILRERGVVPGKIGIDGIPGSGKSTLAAALAEALGMECRSLDHRNLLRPGTLDRERTVYEHHRLLRTQDVDAFDAIIYIDEPIERSRARVRRRKRGLFLGALLDQEKLKRIGDLAFEVCEGEAVAVPNSDLLVKTRPPGGFRAVGNITSRIAAAPGLRGRFGGVGSAEQAREAGGPDASAVDRAFSAAPGGARHAGRALSKEEMLFLLAYGERREGLAAYLSPHSYVVRIGRIAGGLRSAGKAFASALVRGEPSCAVPENGGR